MMDEDAPLAGGCNCGAVRYKLSAPPLTVMACHCTSCRRQSGATYSVNLVVRAETMAVAGELARWTDHDTETGAPLFREFCARCGSPIRSALSASPAILVVKAGTLDRPDPFAPAMHVWTASKLGWVTVPDGIPAFERNPPG